MFLNEKTRQTMLFLALKIILRIVGNLVSFQHKTKQRHEDDLKIIYLD